MRKLFYILVLIFGISLLIGCEKHGNKGPKPEDAIMHDGEYEGIGE